MHEVHAPAAVLRSHPRGSRRRWLTAIFATAVTLALVYVVSYFALRERRERHGELDVLFGENDSRPLEVLFTPLVEAERLVREKQRVDAETVISSALEQARSQGKPLMLIIGGDHCLSCRQLERLIDENHSRFTKHYIIATINLDSMIHGSEVHGRYRDLNDSLPNYIPFTVILNADGNVLATSGEMDGAIGLPMAGDADRAAYVNMLRRTAKQMTDKELTAIDQAAIDFRRTLEVE